MLKLAFQHMYQLQALFSRYPVFIQTWWPFNLTLKILFLKTGTDVSMICEYIPFYLLFILCLLSSIPYWGDDASWYPNCVSALRFWFIMQVDTLISFLAQSKLMRFGNSLVLIKLCKLRSTIPLIKKVTNIYCCSKYWDNPATSCSCLLFRSLMLITTCDTLVHCRYCIVNSPVFRFYMEFIIIVVHYHYGFSYPSGAYW